MPNMKFVLLTCVALFAMYIVAYRPLFIVQFDKALARRISYYFGIRPIKMDLPGGEVDATLYDNADYNGWSGTVGEIYTIREI